MKRFLLMSVALMATLCTFAQDVAYIDADGKSQTLSSGGYQTISSQNEWTNGWYVLENSGGVSGRITVSGTVHLILKDGCTLTVPMGIHLNEGNSLTIYGQANGTGKLTVGPCNDYLAGIGGDNHERAGTLIVNGGSVEATAGYSAAGIGGGAQGYWAGEYGHGGTVIINGGKVTAKGSGYGAGIGGGGNHNYSANAIPGKGGVVIINGGEVTATGGSDGGYGIGPGRSSGNEGETGTLSLGWRYQTDRIYMSSVKAEVTLKSDFVYEDSKEAVTADNLDGRAIIPSDTSAPSSRKLKGDVNDDGSVDISDVVATINHMAGTAVFARADVNKDSSVDISDVVAIINIIAKGIKEYEDENINPVEEDFAVLAGWCPDSNHPHIIDMGPAGKWACCNVGASNPQDFGGYYAWGETEEKDYYDLNTYSHCDGSFETMRNIGNDIAGTDYDVAHVKWGGQWQMPNQEQIQSLLDNCESYYVTDKVSGISFSYGGNILFLPTAGERIQDLLITPTSGRYWLSTICELGNSDANHFSFSQWSNGVANEGRRYGLPVRPIVKEEINVTTDPAVEAGLCPDSNHPHTIDLGGEVYYSCCNVGASAPWEYGSYYAWGEVNEKTTYYWETYQYGSSATSCNDIGHNIAGTQYDAAYVLWGGNWQTPAISHLDFLTGKCTMEWLILNNINGVKYTGPNGNSIFLPASGDKGGSGEPSYLGTDANYASSEIPMGREGTYGFVCYLSLDDNSSAHQCSRSKGLSVRPVTEGDGTQPDAAVEAGICPDEHHPHIIDLGLDVKFSCCNVGASAPWKAGGFYAWGETETKNVYSSDNYKYNSNGSYKDLGSDISGTQYDAAKVQWGGEWHMPSSVQLRQLNEDCRKEPYMLKGVDGMLITGPNGAKIFLPASGYNDEGYYSYNGTRGYYWSSNPSKTDSRALCFQFVDDQVTNDYILFRDCGLTVRPVYGQPNPNSDAAVRAGLCPDAQHPHVIDMGNGLKFSCCNVGASAPWEYGGHYAWGETDVKSYYNNDNYQYFRNLKFVDIGSNISGTQYDVAFMKVGNAWCMPTRNQMQYLQNDCTRNWISLNGINGMKFTSTNGSSIFLPAAGWYIDTELDSQGYIGEYWTSNNVSNNVNDARSFSINDSGVYISTDGRVQGLSVRPIAK